MKIKSYYARTVEDAMAAARQELGPEAMLVNTRKAPPEARGLGEYEVVFASDLGPDEAAGPAAGISSGLNGGAGHAPRGDRLSDEVAELKKELEGMRRAMTRTALAPSEWLAQSQELSDAYAALAANEVAPDLARDIVQAASARTSESRTSTARQPRWDPAALERAVIEEMESRVVAEPVLGRGENRPRVVALVGPPGCGKTTTLVKLAVNYGLAARRPSLLFTMDTYRVAAADQLRSYASILGLGFQVFETVGSLSQAIEENRGKELIFIDTPGLGFGDMENAPALASFLASRGDIDTQLVLSSSMKSADLSHVVEAYERFRPRRLLFTRLDETSSFGPIFNQAASTGKPLSFFGTGQRIPEDLETASRNRLSELVFSGRGARALSAA
jgi:flagellar biosynthesis protein FlhF